jgi:hypothetical protein
VTKIVPSMDRRNDIHRPDKLNAQLAL